MKIYSEEVIQKVKEKTMLLIKYKGSKGWNMADLAKESGLAKDTLYRLIGSKEKWLRDVLVAKVTKNQQLVVDIMNNNEVYLLKLERIIYELSNFIFELSTENMKEVLEAFPAISEEIYSIKNDLDEEIVDFIQSGINNGFFVEDLEPKFLYEMVKASLFYFVKSENSSKTRENVYKSLNYLLKGTQKH